MMGQSLGASGVISTGPVGLLTPVYAVEVKLTDAQVRTLLATPVLIIAPGLTQGKMIMPIWIGCFANVTAFTIAQNATIRFVGNLQTVATFTLCSINGKRYVNQSATVFSIQNAADLAGVGIEIIANANSAAYTANNDTRIRIVYSLV